MTPEQFKESTQTSDAPLAGLSAELTSLWHTRVGNWEAAHNIAQEIHTPLGSHIHAHLHLIEGDLSNAAYWFRKAGRPVKSVSELPEHWEELVFEAFQQSEE